MQYNERTKLETAIDASSIRDEWRQRLHAMLHNCVALHEVWAMLWLCKEVYKRYSNGLNDDDLDLAVKQMLDRGRVDRIQMFGCERVLSADQSGPCAWVSASEPTEGSHEILADEPTVADSAAPPKPWRLSGTKWSSLYAWASRLVVWFVRLIFRERFDD